MATFTIIENGFITEPYATTYGFQSVNGQNTLREIDGDKYGLIVTVSDGVTSKTFYYEVENIAYDGLNPGMKLEGFPNEATRNYWLQKLANDFENL